MIHWPSLLQHVIWQGVRVRCECHSWWIAVWIKLLPAALWVYVDNLCVAGTCYWSIAWQLWWFGPVISALPPSSARHTLNSTKAPSGAWWTKMHWMQKWLHWGAVMCRATCRGSSKALFQHSFGTGWGLSKMGIDSIWNEFEVQRVVPGLWWECCYCRLGSMNPPPTVRFSKRLNFTTIGSPMHWQVACCLQQAIWFELCFYCSALCWHGALWFAKLPLHASKWA